MGAGAVAVALIVSLTVGSGELTDASSKTTQETTPTTSPSTSTSQSTPESTPPTITSTLSADDRKRLAGAVTRAVDGVVSGTDIGFALYDEQTGETLVSVAPDQQFYTASVVKLLIALDVMHSAGWHVPEARTLDQVTEMLRLSHDGIADALWSSGGQRAIVTRMANLIGLAHTTAPSVADQWEMTRTTANDLVKTYEFLRNDVPAEVSTPILDALAAARNPAADGFPQYFGIPDALPGMHWAIKQGWMEIRRGVVLNTTGLVESRYVVVLLTQLPLGTSYQRGRTALTAGITAVASVLAGPRNG